MLVVPEGGMHQFWDATFIIDGHTTEEHSLPVAPLYGDYITLFAQSGSGYTPTFVVAYGGLFGENYWYNEEDVFDDQLLLSYTPENIIDPRSIRREKAPFWDYHHINISQSVAEIFYAGGTVNTGAHGQLQGLGFHWEIGMFSQGGLSNYEALQCATVNGATSLGLINDIGTIEIGKLADLVFYDVQNNPLNNITNSRNVKWVMLRGALYDASSMNQTFPVQIGRDPIPFTF